MLGRALPSAVTGAGLGIEVADAATGRILYADNADEPATPASTTKLVTAVASLAALGAGARFTTTVRQTGGTIVLTGGGDPTLAVNRYPSADYPRPATLAQLAAATARALQAQGRRSVRLGYDIALFSGPDLAPGWNEGDIALGDVTPIVALEADQGRLTAGGALEDDDDPVNYRPRTDDPAGMTAAAFAGLLIAERHHRHRTPAQAAAPASAPVLASVSSPPLAAIVEQMLVESNNVIAENLARHVAIALGLPATFSGAAAADLTELRRLGITTPISLVDGSGLSPDDKIAPETLVRVLATAAGRPALRGRPQRAPGGRVQRHALGGRQRLRRDRRGRARCGAGQDGQPEHGGNAGRPVRTTRRARCCFSRSWRRRCRAPASCRRPRPRSTRRQRAWPGADVADGSGCTGTPRTAVSGRRLAIRHDGRYGVAPRAIQHVR